MTDNAAEQSGADATRAELDAPLTLTPEQIATVAAGFVPGFIPMGLRGYVRAEQ